MDKYVKLCFFFFQAEDGIRDAQESRGLGDVYKRQTRALAVHYARANGNIFALRSGDVGSAAGKSRCGAEDDAVCAVSATIKVCYSSVAIEAEKAAARLAEEEARRAIFFPTALPPTNINITNTTTVSYTHLTLPTKRIV
eukprot:TRINITY_DN62983_c0_g1_i1.p1 TRINITY_DN62983_c0_g1~~TRINITY_DN62983_c0_g1_i1.p1  ORF type:complete len:140 (+),score=47.84 TRINITY_DN62983_c0_g1_i1:42-461(+)